jgi:tRNA nucleotidyltransferase (CCA-adding enzyme)
MKIYAVGGAVRDELLGLPVKDRDFVVVGSTPQEMTALGYRPVGRDFPVFLHPQTHEEYALARTERKTARGYRGFSVHASPEVTLEEDLARRDLTINAMARDSAGALIDPFGGAQDLRCGLLRHVSSAFAEDPVRILRTARFAARFGFRIADETLQLMRQMVDSGEVDALVPERVWQELSRGLMEKTPSRMFSVLSECGALPRLLPEAAGATDPRSWQAADAGALRGAALAERFAAWLGLVQAPMAERTAEHLRASGECRELLLLVSRLQARIRAAGRADAAELAAILRDADAFRRPERLAQLLDACADIATVAGEPLPPVWHARITRARAAAASIDTRRIAQGAKNIGEAIHAARVEAVQALLSAARSDPAR